MPDQVGYSEKSRKGTVGQKVLLRHKPQWWGKNFSFRREIRAVADSLSVRCNAAGYATEARHAVSSKDRAWKVHGTAVKFHS